MRIATVMIEQRVRTAIVRNDRVDLLPSDTGITAADMLAMGTDEREAAATGSDSRPLDAVEWLPPVTPALTVGIGLNTRSHFEETTAWANRVPGDYPARPRLFTRSHDSLVGHRQPIIAPAVSTMFDYEGEIALVIGDGGRAIPIERAMAHVGGYTCCNEGSVRDFQQHSNQVTAGKNFVASGAVGPWIVTADEVGDPAALTLETRVNGELRQQLRMDDLIFSFASLISYVSTIFLLRPGDMILTGSPAGIGGLVGAWLKAGDTVEIHVPAIGTLSNTVADERAAV